jgi:5-methylcytosine-specific restriction endonuclease McrA
MLTKICSSCGADKLIDEFYKDNRYKDGVRGVCKSCLNDYSTTYKENNPELIKNNMRKHILNNTIKIWAHHVIASHKSKGYPVDFKINELIKLSQTTPICKYCDSKLDYTTPFGNRKHIERTTAPTVDRINNELNLTIDNIEIICNKCNVTKQDRTRKDFYEYCKNIYLKFKGEFND